MNFESDSNLRENGTIFNEGKEVSLENEDLIDVCKKIQNKKLTPDNIDSYGETIITELINLVGEVTKRYSKANEEQEQKGKEFEDAAFKYYGLTDLHILLGRAQQKILEIEEISSFLKQSVRYQDEIIIPPDPTGNFQFDGGTPLEKSTFTPRLKTLLYILKEGGVNLESIEVIEGKILPKMFRQTSYVTVVIPKLDRVVQVCDEDGNVSYVFKLSSLSMEKVNNMTKIEKNEFIKTHPGAGVRVVQTDLWRWYMEENLFGEIQNFTQKEKDLEAFTAEGTELSKEIPQVSGDELDPWRGFWTDKEGNHWGTRTALARKLEKTQMIFKKRLSHESLQPIKIADMFRRTQDGYCYEKFVNLFPELMEEKRVATEGEWRGFWTDEKTGRHWGSAGTLKNKFNVTDWVTIKRYIKKNGLPEINIVDLAGRTSPSYCYEDFLEIEGFFDFLTAPEVEKTGEWTGFWIDPEGKHWATLGFFADYFSTTGSTILEYFTDKKPVTRSIKTLSGEIQKGYCLESLQDNKEFMEFAKYPRVDKEGEWRSFWTNSEDGRHWGPKSRIAFRLGLKRDRVDELIDANEESFPYKMIKDTMGKPFKCYCIEDVAKKV